MPFTRKPEGEALTHHAEYRAAMRHAWTRRAGLYANGISLSDARQECIVHLISQRSQYDPQRAAYSTWCWTLARRFIHRMMEAAESRKRGMDGYRIERRTIPAFRPKEEVAEHMRMLMKHLSPRRRQMVTHFAAGWTLEQMGKRHGVTRERCRQILGKSLRDMRIRAMEIANKAGVSANEYWSDLLCPR